jgi:hypothetical protein
MVQIRRLIDFSYWAGRRRERGSGRGRPPEVMK